LQIITQWDAFAAPLEASSKFGPSGRHQLQILQLSTQTIVRSQMSNIAIQPKHSQNAHIGA